MLGSTSLPWSFMDDHLSKLIFGVSKNDGSDYAPTSFKGFVSSIERYLNKQNYGFTIFADAVLKTTMLK